MYKRQLSGWHGVKTEPNSLPITGMNTVPNREQEAFAGRLLRTPNGETVLDFGQNMAVRLSTLRPGIFAICGGRFSLPVLGS